MRSVIRQINTVHPLKNITRRDKSWHGWEFQKSVNNVKTSELFYDKDYDRNPAESLQAALTYRAKFLKKNR